MVVSGRGADRGTGHSLAPEQRLLEDWRCGWDPARGLRASRLPAVRRPPAPFTQTLVWVVCPGHTPPHGGGSPTPPAPPPIPRPPPAQALLEASRRGTRTSGALAAAMAAGGATAGAAGLRAGSRRHSSNGGGVLPGWNDIDALVANFEVRPRSVLRLRTGAHGL